MNDLHIKLSDAVDHSKWRRMIGGNWSERSNDSDADSWMGIVYFWCRLTQQANLPLNEFVVCCFCWIVCSCYFYLYASLSLILTECWNGAFVSVHIRGGGVHWRTGERWNRCERLLDVGWLSRRHWTSETAEISRVCWQEIPAWTGLLCQIHLCCWRIMTWSVLAISDAVYCSHVYFVCSAFSGLVEQKYNSLKTLQGPALMPF